MNNDVVHLSEILKLIDKIKESKNDKAIEILQEKDTRKTFFEMLAGSLRVYYLGLDSIFIANKINHSNFTFNEFEVPHIERFGWLLDKKYLEDVYLPTLKMNLINDCWVCFESTLRDIFYVKEHIKYKNHIWEIYTDKIFDSRDINITKDNKKFLGFLGHCRNAMHNNSIHDPKNEIDKYNNWEYTIGEKFKLEKSKKIKFMTKEVVLELINKLSDVALDMWKNLNYPGFIPDRYNSK